MVLEGGPAPPPGVLELGAVLELAAWSGLCGAAGGLELPVAGDVPGELAGARLRAPAERARGCPAPPAGRARAGGAVLAHVHVTFGAGMSELSEPCRSDVGTGVGTDVGTGPGSCRNRGPRSPGAGQARAGRVVTVRIPKPRAGGPFWSTQRDNPGPLEHPAGQVRAARARAGERCANRIRPCAQRIAPRARAGRGPRAGTVPCRA